MPYLAAPAPTPDSALILALIEAHTALRNLLPTIALSLARPGCFPNAQDVTEHLDELQSHLKNLEQIVASRR